MRYSHAVTTRLAPMPIHGVPFDELQGQLRSKAALALETTGDVRFLEAIATAPHMAKFYFDDFYREVFYGGIVPVRVKEMVRLRLSNLHGCVY